MANFEYVETTETTRNYIDEETKSILNSGITPCQSVQNLLSSHLLYKSLKIKIYKTMILPVVLYGCETYSLTLRKEHTLSVFKNRVLRKPFGPMREEVAGGWEKLHNGNLHKFHTSPNIIRVCKSRNMRWTGRHKYIQNYGR
jgi:hypothetical protein